jgi:uncharacterized protein HemX
MNLRDPIYVLVILALMAFIGFQSYTAGREKERRISENREFQATIEKHRQTAQRARARADSLYAVFVKRRVVDSVALRVLSVRNKAMSETVQKLRQPVQPLIDSLPQLRAFVLANDSLLAMKDEQIQQMELRHEAQIIDLEGVIKDRGREIMAQAQETEAYKTELAESQKETRKERRGKNFWKVTAGIVTGVVLYLSVRE